jgi:hypothetical protein
MFTPKPDRQWQLEIAQAEEEALRSFLVGPVMEVTLRSGTESLTVAVESRLGICLVKELLNAAIAHRQQASEQLNS